MIVEVRTNDFEFYRKDNPTGHHMRGEVIGDMPERGNVRIESLSNGKEYVVNVRDVIVVEA